jgi:hypothetical protein
MHVAVFCSKFIQVILAVVVAELLGAALTTKFRLLVIIGGQVCVEVDIVAVLLAFGIYVFRRSYRAASCRHHSYPW